MNSKEKAKDLVTKFNHFHDTEKKEYILYQDPTESIRCALIAVDELIKMESMFLSEIIKICDAAKFNYEIHYEYWQEVKQEIEKL